MNRAPLSTGSLRWRVALAAILTLAAVLRTVQLGREGLWFDEAHSVAVADRGLVGLVGNLDNQAPLYFALLTGAVAVLGHSEWAVRSLSAVASVATVWLVAVLGGSLLSPAAGLLAAALLAISPMSIHYAQEARPYALLGLLLVAFLLALTEVAGTPGTGRVTAGVMLGGAVVLTHNLGVVYAAGAWIAVVLGWRPLPARRRLALLVVAVAVAAVAALWGLRVSGQLEVMPQTFGWALGPWRDEFPWQLPRSLAALGHGSLAPVRNRVGALIPSAWAGLGLTVLLAIAACRRRAQEERPAAARVLAIATLLPLVVVFAVSSATAVPLYVVGRIDSPALPLLILLLAAGAVQLGRLGPWAVAAACAGLAVLPLEVHYRVDFRSQEKQFATAFAAGLRPGDVVIADYYQNSLVHYLRDGPEVEILRDPPDPLQPDPCTWEPRGGREVAAGVLDEALAVGAASSAARLWVVVHPGTATAVVRQLAAERLQSLGALEDPRVPVIAEAFALPVVERAWPPSHAVAGAGAL